MSLFNNIIPIINETMTEEDKKKDWLARPAAGNNRRTSNFLEVPFEHADGSRSSRHSENESDGLEERSDEQDI